MVAGNVMSIQGSVLCRGCDYIQVLVSCVSFCGVSRASLRVWQTVV